MTSKRYTEEFKIEAVKQVTERGYSEFQPIDCTVGDRRNRLEFGFYRYIAGFLVFNSFNSGMGQLKEG